MGIRWFSTFLKTYPVKLYRRIDFCNQFLIIDGAELLYELFLLAVQDGRGNYLEFRDMLMKFFSTLEKCGVKPIIIKDGFKFEEDEAFYVGRRKKKILAMLNIIEGSRKEPQKGYLCELVFNQTAKELNVPMFTARGNTDEDMAGIARLLNAPILATDTVFCGYPLEAGLIFMDKFNWKQAMTSGASSIQAEVYEIGNLCEKFRVEKEAIFFLPVLFDNNDTEDTFRKFRMGTLKRVLTPPHLNNIRIKRPNFIESCLIWLSENYRNKDDTIRTIIGALPRNVRHEQTLKISQRIDHYSNPKARTGLLKEMIEKIHDDDCKSKISAELNDDTEDQEDLQMRDIMKKVYNGDFPYWALQLLLRRASGKPLVNFLPLVFTNPEIYLSPQLSAFSIRKTAYQILFREEQVEFTIEQYDRVDLEYQKKPSVRLQPFIDERGLFPSYSEVSDDTMAKRKDYLLEILIENEEVRNKYKTELSNPNDDMILTVPATMFWISRALPRLEFIRSLACLFALMQRKQENEVMKRAVESLLESLKKKVNPKKIDVQVLHWCAEWQACFQESINLNQILDKPLPEPIVGGFFSELILDVIFTTISRGEDEKMMIREIEGCEDLYKVNCALFEAASGLN